MAAIYVDSANPKFKSENGLLLSKDGKTLYQGINSNRAVIPTGVEEIKPMAFAGKPNLIDVEMPSTLKIIGNNGFEYCEKL